MFVKFNYAMFTTAVFSAIVCVILRYLQGRDEKNETFISLDEESEGVQSKVRMWW